MNEKHVITGIQDFEAEIVKSDKPAAVYFYSEDCAPCIAFEPIFTRMAETYWEQMKFVRVFRQQNRDLAQKLNVKSSPTVLFYKDGQETCSRLSGYISWPELKASVDGVLGGACPWRERQRISCDVLVLGAGPAGLSAAIYAARAKLFVIVIDESLPGGQVSTTYHVANYPGTNGVIRGIDLMENMKKQATDFGAQIDDMKEIVEIRLDGEEKHVKTEDTDYYAKCIILATGAEPRKLPAEGEKEYRGRGVHYCATCDGALYQDANVLVVGGGNSAVEEAVFLTRFAKKVTIIHQFDHFQASRAAQDEALNHPDIRVIWDTEIRKIKGEAFVTGVTVQNVKTGEMQDLDADGVFVYIGMQPKTQLFKGSVAMDEYGYILCDEDMQTSLPGVFAAGDVRKKKIRQIATAAGDGVIAGVMAEKYINGK